ncbi:methyltransferase domain-containing protein [Mucilaginibacter ginkgonis]|uniref:Methyltransferase domain-containing protein n=1 Tax=Mucilaginibacter ginkgonis TaxID=2682091 RepID=A0A6I4INN1_9SPHI|nr:methyltransferase domain-containing protein [Mucilaginibacter ginkgonis]QQL48883.1 methyltransferase domain-containing protein [Mucilaginibacter ginkgonis]
MSNELTNRDFWKNYWENKTGLAFKVPANYTFHKIIEKITTGNKVKSAIELGGFPGYYAIFLKKYFGVDATLFDYYIHTGVLDEVLDANGLRRTDIGVIEGDLFKIQPEKRYDLVLSAGLIEHFNNTKDIIARHLPFLDPGGTLLITLPNFTGVNGWLQRKYDADNYSKHNISSMDPQKLADYCRQLGLQNVKACYYGKFSVWLENKASQPRSIKVLFKLLWLAGKVATKIVPVESKNLSPYIVVTATKPN